MKRVRGPVTITWNKAKQLVKENKLEEAEEMLDKGIMLMSQHNLAGSKDEDIIEGVKNKVWFERFWITIENHIWPTKKNFEIDWKC